MFNAESAEDTARPDGRNGSCQCSVFSCQENAKGRDPLAQDEALGIQIINAGARVAMA